MRGNAPTGSAAVAPTGASAAPLATVALSSWFFDSIHTHTQPRTFKHVRMYAHVNVCIHTRAHTPIPFANAPGFFVF